MTSSSISSCRQLLTSSIYQVTTATGQLTLSDDVDDPFSGLQSAINVLKLCSSVSDFIRNVATAHKTFSDLVCDAVDQSRSTLSDDTQAGDNEETDSGKLTAIWRVFLDKIIQDAQMHSKLSCQLISGTYRPLTEQAAGSNAQLTSLSIIIDEMEALMAAAGEAVNKSASSQVESYRVYSSCINGSCPGRVDLNKLLAAYQNAHNDYVVQLNAANSLQHHYRNNVIPLLTKELKDINKKLSRQLVDAFTCLSSAPLQYKANDNNTHRPGGESAPLSFPQLQQLTEEMNNGSVGSARNVLAAAPPVDAARRQYYVFNSPSTANLVRNDTLTEPDKIVVCVNTERDILARCAALENDISRLTSYLRQQSSCITNDDTQTPARNSENVDATVVSSTNETSLADKVDVIMAEMQLAVAESQLELLTTATASRQSAAVVSATDVSSSSASTLSSVPATSTVTKMSLMPSAVTFRGLWRSAFRSLRGRDAAASRKTLKVDTGTTPSGGGETNPSLSGSESPRSVLSHRSGKLNKLSSADKDPGTDACSDSLQTTTLQRAGSEQDSNIDPIYLLLKSAADLPSSRSGGPSPAASCTTLAAPATADDALIPTATSFLHPLPPLQLQKINFTSVCGATGSYELHSQGGDTVPANKTDQHQPSSTDTALSTTWQLKQLQHRWSPTNGSRGSSGDNRHRRRTLMATQRSYSCGDLSPNDTDIERDDDTNDSGGGGGMYDTAAWRTLDDRRPNQQQQQSTQSQQQLQQQRLIAGPKSLATHAPARMGPGLANDADFLLADRNIISVHHYNNNVRCNYQLLQQPQQLHPYQQQQQYQQVPVDASTLSTASTSARERRRSGWTDRKQKSKSFDFSWRSGMWSPIDGSVLTSTAMAISADVLTSSAGANAAPRETFPAASASGTNVDGHGLLTVPVAVPVGRGGAAGPKVCGGTIPVNDGMGTSATAGPPSGSSTPKLGECRKTSPKLKIPPMFQMDSGSSYESYEAAECFMQQQMLRQQQQLEGGDKTCTEESDEMSPLGGPTEPIASSTCAGTTHVQHQQQGGGGGDASTATVAPSSTVGDQSRRRDTLQTCVSTRRQWLALQDRKSRSFDSSFEDRLIAETGASGTVAGQQAIYAGCRVPNHGRLGTEEWYTSGQAASAGNNWFEIQRGPGWLPNDAYRSQQQQQHHQQQPPPQPYPTYELGGGDQSAPTRDRRRRLRQTQRKSRSLDVYEPQDVVVPVIAVAADGRIGRVGSGNGEQPQQPPRRSPLSAYGQQYVEHGSPSPAKFSTSQQPTATVETFRHFPPEAANASDNCDSTSSGRALSGTGGSRRSPGRVSQQLAGTVPPRSESGRSPPSPRERRPSPLRPTQAVEHQSRRLPRTTAPSDASGQLPPRSPASLSPREQTGTGNDRRITFAAQKSFSYDIPNVEPRPVVHYRKQSEPTVSSPYGGAMRLRPALGGPGNRMLPRLPIAGAQLEQRINQFSHMVMLRGGGGVNYSVDMDALPSMKRADNLVTAAPGSAAATAVTQVPSAAASQLVKTVAVDVQQPTKHVQSVSPIPSITKSPAAAAATALSVTPRRSSAAVGSTAEVPLMATITDQQQQQTADVGSGRSPSAEDRRETSGKRQMFSCQKSLSYEVNQFQFQIHGTTTDDGNSAVPTGGGLQRQLVVHPGVFDRKRDYFDENEIQEFEIEHPDGSATRVWHPPPLDDDDIVVTKPEMETALAPKKNATRRVRIAASDRRAEFSEQRSFSYDVASSSGVGRKQRVSYEVRLAPPEVYSPEASGMVNRRSPREFGTRLMRQSNIKARDAVAENIESEQANNPAAVAAAAQTATATDVSGLTRRVSPRSHQTQRNQLPASAAASSAVVAVGSGQNVVHSSPCLRPEATGAIVDANQIKQHRAQPPPQTDQAPSAVDRRAYGHQRPPPVDELQQRPQRRSVVIDERCQKSSSGTRDGGPTFTAAARLETKSVVRPAVESRDNQKHREEFSAQSETNAAIMENAIDRQHRGENEIINDISPRHLSNQNPQQQVMGADKQSSNTTGRVEIVSKGLDHRRERKAVESCGVDSSYDQHVDVVQPSNTSAVRKPSPRLSAAIPDDGGSPASMRASPSGNYGPQSADMSSSMTFLRSILKEDDPNRSAVVNCSVEDNDDDVGELVSDGIVTWRRKLPDLGRIARAKQQQQLMQQRQYSLFQQTMHQPHYGGLQQSGPGQAASARQQAFADSGRTMSLAVPPRFDHYVASGRSRHAVGGRRDAFAQQKSFSCEAATGRTGSGGLVSSSASPSPSPTSRSPVGVVRLPPGQDNQPTSMSSGGGHVSHHHHHHRHSDRKRMAKLGAKKSYSLDDQQLSVAEYEMMMAAMASSGATGSVNPAPSVQQRRDDFQQPQSQVMVGADDVGGAVSERPGGTSSGSRRHHHQQQPQQHKKLMMLHTMKAVAHDQYEPAQGVVNATAASVAAADATAGSAGSGVGNDVSRSEEVPEIAKQQNTGSSSRLPIAKLWERLRPDRNRTSTRPIAAGGSRK